MRIRKRGSQPKFVDYSIKLDACFTARGFVRASSVSMIILFQSALTERTFSLSLFLSLSFLFRFLSSIFPLSFSLFPYVSADSQDAYYVNEPSGNVDITGTV